MSSNLPDKSSGDCTWCLLKLRERKVSKKSEKEDSREIFVSSVVSIVTFSSNYY